MWGCDSSSTSHQTISKEPEKPFFRDKSSLIFTPPAVFLWRHALVLYEMRGMEYNASFTAVMVFCCVCLWSAHVKLWCDQRDLLFTRWRVLRASLASSSLLRANWASGVWSVTACVFCFIQTTEHPNPGKKYSARGFPRHCYLPDNEKGRKVRFKIWCESYHCGLNFIFTVVFQDYMKI